VKLFPIKNLPQFINNLYSEDYFSKSSYNFPQSELESWKYTNLKKIFDFNNINSFSPKHHKNISKEYVNLYSKYLVDKAQNIVLLDGMLIYENLLAGVKLENSSMSVNQIKRHVYNPLVRINGMFNEIFLKLVVDANMDHLDNPIIIHYLHTDKVDSTLLSYFTKIDIGRNSRIFLKEKFVSLSSKKSAFNIKMETFIKDNANFTYDVLDSPCESIVMNHISINLLKNSSFNSFVMQSSLNFTRYEYHINLLEKNSKSNISGVSFLHGSKQLDLYVFVSHYASHTESRVNFRSTVGYKSKYNLGIKAYVSPKIKNIYSSLHSRSIHLDNLSIINIKPEFDIHSEDVVCNHGVTIGSLDENAFFYLASRGISNKEAQVLLVEAFFFSIINNLKREDAIVEKYKVIFERILNKEILSLIL